MADQNKPKPYEGPDIVIDDLDKAGLSAIGPARLIVEDLAFQENINNETKETFVTIRGTFKVVARPDGDLEVSETLFDNFGTSKKGLWKFRDLIEACGGDAAKKGKSLQAHAKDLKGKRFVASIDHQLSKKNKKTYETLKSFRKDFRRASPETASDDL